MQNCTDCQKLNGCREKGLLTTLLCTLYIYIYKTQKVQIFVDFFKILNESFFIWKNCIRQVISQTCCLQLFRAGIMIYFSCVRVILVKSNHWNWNKASFIEGFGSDFLNFLQESPPTGILKKDEFFPNWHHQMQKTHNNRYGSKKRCFHFVAIMLTYFCLMKNHSFDPQI